MTAPLLHLVSSQQKPVRACETCKHYRNPPAYPHDYWCEKTGLLIVDARKRTSICKPEGKMWEPRPRAIERAWRWLVGGRG